MPTKSKKFEVVKATKKPIDGVNTGIHDHKFNRQGMFHITDPGEAKAIEQSVGQKGTGEVVVIDIPNNDERGIAIHAMPRNWEGFKYKTIAEREAAKGN